MFGGVDDCVWMEGGLCFEEWRAMFGRMDCCVWLEGGTAVFDGREGCVWREGGLWRASSTGPKDLPLPP